MNDLSVDISNTMTIDNATDCLGGGERMKDRTTVEDIIELYDPDRTGKDVVIIENNKKSLVETRSIMLREIGDIPVARIDASERGDIRMWLDKQALEERWERATT